MPFYLKQPIANGEQVSVNFFNGRLLSGEDLSTEQRTNRLSHALLGKAIGEGVVQGLEVKEATGVSSTASPALEINQGLAINRRGYLLQLDQPVQLRIGQPPVAQNTATTVFQDCQPPEDGVYIAASGVYMLVMSPVGMSQGLATVSGLGNQPGNCNTKYKLDAVQFRLVQLGISLADLASGKLQNLVAYRCSSSVRKQAFFSDASSVGSTSAIARLQDSLLTDCDVPLCVLYWTSSAGIVWIDMWAVRRSAMRPGVEHGMTLLGPQAEEEAIHLQFQNQIQRLQSAVNAPFLKAKDLFRFLPPIGLLPVSSGAFDHQAFFAQITIRGPVFIEGARLEPLLRHALCYPPIDLERGELIRLYRVRENHDPRVNVSGPKPSYLVFVTGHAPFAGSAHANVARWDYSNYF